MRRIIITGALGQIGSELTAYLRSLYGEDAVLATDIRQREGMAEQAEHYRTLDVLDRAAVLAAAKQHRADTIIHLAALLSATAEAQPQLAWHLNVDGLVHVLETARELGCQLFVPSSIAVFGEGTPRSATPQDTLQRPNTMYGVGKVAGELLCDYYYAKYGVDARGIRFPGLISHTAPPGGGTTDYAVDMYVFAAAQGRYTSYIAPDTYLDMMYMPDAVRAIVQLMEADGSRLTHRNAFNVSAMSVDPEAIARSIRRYVPHFQLDYKIDPVRQRIADSWPDALDVSAARDEWGFAPAYDLDRMTADMLRNLGGAEGAAAGVDGAMDGAGAVRVQSKAER